MKILHAPVEIAGQVGLSVKGLRELGYLTHSFYEKNRFDYEPANFSATSKYRGLREIQKALFAVQNVGKYDIMHFHFAQSFSHRSFHHIDVQMLKKAGAKIFVEFWGSDIRNSTIELQRNPYYHLGQSKDKEGNANLALWSELTNGHVIVADCFANVVLEKYFSNIHIVGQRVDLSRFSPNYPDENSLKPLLVHAPSHKKIKGTYYVQKAVEKLRKKGIEFEYIEVSGISNEEAREIYKRADLVIDQLILGAHGVFAAEAMALGKPVICYILPELATQYPSNLPIINANPDTIESVLEEWLQKPKERYELGKKSRLYAEKHHGYRQVSKKLIDVYRKSLMQGSTDV